MKYIALLILNFYTRFLSPVLHQLLGVKTACRYEVTCSHYAVITIEKYGILKGGFLSVRRLINCQPLFNL